VDIADRIVMAAQGLRYSLIGEGVSLVTIQEQQDTGSGLRPGGCLARSNQGVECRPLVVS
jgi:hypothetical protein